MQVRSDKIDLTERQSGSERCMKKVVLLLAVLQMFTCAGAQVQREPSPSELFLEAAAAVNLPAMRSALKAGADVDARDKDGRTAAILMTFVKDSQNAAEAVRLLRAAGADFSLKDLTGRTALNWAKINGNFMATAELEKSPPK
jgi:hypothetical protein